MTYSNQESGNPKSRVSNFGSPASQVSTSFRTFYRSHLGFRSGPRLRSTTVAQLYGDWAEMFGAPSMSLNEIGRAMASFGHRRLRSNGIYFADVELAADGSGLADDTVQSRIARSQLLVESTLERIEADLDWLRGALSKHRADN